jgi:hypothetical protein
MLGFLNALPRHMSRSLVAESSPRASAQRENGHCRFTKAIIAAVFLLPDFYAYYIPSTTVCIGNLTFWRVSLAEQPRAVTEKKSG